MSLHQKTYKTFDGRRLASRAIVLQSMQSIPCYCFRKEIIKVPNSAFDERLDETWGGLGVASDADEHAFDYVSLGHAMMTVERFMGGYVHDGDGLVVPDEIAIMGLVEPYDIDLKGRERLQNVPEWTPKKGDVFCMLLDEDNYIYLECVGRTGSSLVSDFGAKYVFNQKFDLDFIGALDETNIVDRRLPEKTT